MFLALYLLIADPAGSFGDWFLCIYLLTFAAYGLGYFFSAITVHPVTGMIVGTIVAVSDDIM